jgi:hypothetical protein
MLARDIIIHSNLQEMTGQIYTIPIMIVLVSFPSKKHGDRQAELKNKIFPTDDDL